MLSTFANNIKVFFTFGDFKLFTNMATLIWVFSLVATLAPINVSQMNIYLANSSDQDNDSLNTYLNITCANISSVIVPKERDTINFANLSAILFILFNIVYIRFLQYFILHMQRRISLLRICTYFRLFPCVSKHIQEIFPEFFFVLVIDNFCGFSESFNVRHCNIHARCFDFFDLGSLGFFCCLIRPFRNFFSSVKQYRLVFSRETVINSSAHHKRLCNVNVVCEREIVLNLVEFLSQNVCSRVFLSIDSSKLKRRVQFAKRHGCCACAHHIESVYEYSSARCSDFEAFKVFRLLYGSLGV